MGRKFDIERDYIDACRLLAEMQQMLDRALRASFYIETYDRLKLWKKAFDLLELLQTYDSYDTQNSQAFDAKAQDREDETPK